MFACTPRTNEHQQVNQYSYQPYFIQQWCNQLHLTILYSAISPTRKCHELWYSFFTTVRTSGSPSLGSQGDVLASSRSSVTSRVSSASRPRNRNNGVMAVIPTVHATSYGELNCWFSPPDKRQTNSKNELWYVVIKKTFPTCWQFESVWLTHISIVLASLPGVLLRCSLARPARYPSVRVQRRWKRTALVRFEHLGTVLVLPFWFIKKHEKPLGPNFNHNRIHWTKTLFCCFYRGFVCSRFFPWRFWRLVGPMGYVYDFSSFTKFRKTFSASGSWMLVSWSLYCHQLKKELVLKSPWNHLACPSDIAIHRVDWFRSKKDSKCNEVRWCSLLDIFLFAVAHPAVCHRPGLPAFGSSRSPQHGAARPGSGRCHSQRLIRKTSPNSLAKPWF